MNKLFIAVDFFDSVMAVGDFLALILEIGLGILLLISLIFGIKNKKINLKPIGKFALKVLGISLAVIAVFFLITMFIAENISYKEKEILGWLIYFSAVGFFTWYVLKDIITVINLHINGKHTTGIFMNYELAINGRFIICVEYSVDEISYIYKGRQFKSDKKLKIGDEVDILYNPKNPDKSCIYKHSALKQIFPTILVILIIICTFLSLNYS